MMDDSDNQFVDFVNYLARALPWPFQTLRAARSALNRPLGLMIYCFGRVQPYRRYCKCLPSPIPRDPAAFASSLLAGVAVLALVGLRQQPHSACARPTFPSMPKPRSQSTLGELAAALQEEAQGQGRDHLLRRGAARRGPARAGRRGPRGRAWPCIRSDPDLRIAYAKALTAAGRFEQALTVIDDTIDPDLAGLERAPRSRARSSTRWAATRKRGSSTSRR